MRRLATSVIGVLATLGLLALPVPAQAEAGFPPCSTFTVQNRGSTWSTRISDDGVWYTIYPGATSPFRSWDKIQVPSNGKDVKLSASGFYPTQIFHNDGVWYSPTNWHCGTMPDSQVGGNYWWFHVASNGYFD